jgi:hypothetical protein
MTISLITCRHRPPCPTINPWVCSQRTIYEQGVDAGQITRAAAEAILRKWGTILSPESKVFKGELVKPDRTLW